MNLLIDDWYLIAMAVALCILLVKTWFLWKCPRCGWPLFFQQKAREVSRRNHDYRAAVVRRCKRCAHEMERIEERNDDPGDD
jgi:hypothetical protein